MACLYEERQLFYKDKNENSLDEQGIMKLQLLE